MEDEYNLVVENNTNSPSTSQLNANNDNFDDTKSTATSVSALQMPFLESRLESEMTTYLGNMMKDKLLVSLSMLKKLSEVDKKF